MTKEKKMYYSVTFPLKTDKRTEDILNKRLGICCMLYNELMAREKARFREYKSTKAYKRAVSLTKEKVELSSKGSLTPEEKTRLKEIKVEIKDIYNTLQKHYGFSEFSFINEMTKLYKIYNKNIDSATAAAIAKRVWTSFSACLFRDGKEPHFKKRRDYNTLTSQRKNAGIRIKDRKLVWGKDISIPIKIDENKPYEKFSFVDENIVYPIIKKKGEKFYVQILFEGIPYSKGRDAGVGTVGIQLGTKHVYVAAKDRLIIKDLPSLEGYKEKIAEINKKLEASRASTNPNKYNEDGTVKTGNRDKWVYSKAYKRLLKKKQELERKQAEYRKQQYYIMANEIVALGGRFVILKPNLAAMRLKSNTIQRSAENAEERKKQRVEAKKRRDIQNFAPAEFIQTLKMKAAYYGCEVVEVDSGVSKWIRTVNHVDESLDEERMSLTTDTVNGVRVERKLYNAFLLRHYDFENKGLDENTDSDFKNLF